MNPYQYQVLRYRSDPVVEVVGLDITSLYFSEVKFATYDELVVALDDIYDRMVAIYLREDDSKIHDDKNS